MPRYQFVEAPHQLSSRQMLILSLIAKGDSDKEIAAALGISYRTVRTHLDRLFKAYKFRSRSEAVAVWLAEGNDDLGVVPHAESDERSREAVSLAEQWLKVDGGFIRQSVFASNP